MQQAMATSFVLPWCQSQIKCTASSDSEINYSAILLCIIYTHIPTTVRKQQNIQPSIGLTSFEIPNRIGLLNHFQLAKSNIDNALWLRPCCSRRKSVKHVVPQSSHLFIESIRTVALLASICDLCLCINTVHCNKQTHTHTYTRRTPQPNVNNHHKQ